MTDMTFEEWLNYGMDRHWIGPPVCETHDGLPMTATEENDWANGDDTCVHILRLYHDLATRKAVEANHSPSVWRARR